MNKDNYQAEYFRVQRVGEILARIETLKQWLRKMDTLKELAVTSCNDYTFRPDIPTEQISVYVHRYYDAEQQRLEAELERLYPER